MRQPADGQPRRGGGEQEGQDGEGLGKADLHRAEGQAEYIAEIAHHSVQRRRHGGQDQIADSDFAHKNTSSKIFRVPAHWHSGGRPFRAGTRFPARGSLPAGWTEVEVGQSYFTTPPRPCTEKFRPALEKRFVIFLK